MDEKGGEQGDSNHKISTNYINSKIIITVVIAVLFGLAFVVGLIAFGYHLANGGNRSSGNSSGAGAPAVVENIEVKYSTKHASYTPVRPDGSANYKSELLHSIGVNDADYAIIRSSSELDEFLTAVNTHSNFKYGQFAYSVDDDFFKSGTIIVVAKEEMSLFDTRVNGVSRDENYNVSISMNYTIDSSMLEYGGEFMLLKIENIQPKSVTVDWSMEERDDPSPYGPLEKKPVIYLYPTKTTIAKVRLSNPERIVVDYPDYRDGWDVTAYPDGTLKTASGKKLYALYYESRNIKHYTSDSLKEGFVVAKDDVESFLDEKLEILGLNYKEREEFITYWAGILEEKPYAFIRFQTRAEIERNMGLTVTPQPDTIIRIIMEYKPLNRKIVTTEQTLEPATRSGFTVVEWGGAEIK